MGKPFGTALLLTLLAGCGSALSDAEAKAVCSEWVEKSNPDYEITLRKPVTAEEDRMVTISGTAVKGADRKRVQCAVDIQEGKVIAGFN